MKKIFMFAVIAISGLFLTTNVYAKTSDPVCTNGNITSMNSSNEACILTSELTIDATSVEKTINGIIKVQSGGKLTITGNSKVTLNHSIIVYGGGELIIYASNVEATHGIASVFGKMKI